jgi:hypothetical protein
MNRNDDMSGSRNENVTNLESSRGNSSEMPMSEREEQ